MITREHALPGLHHQVTSPPSRIARCLLIQTKRDKENMKHQSTPAVGQIYTETTGKLVSPHSGDYKIQKTGFAYPCKKRSIPGARMSESSRGQWRKRGPQRKATIKHDVSPKWEKFHATGLGAKKTYRGRKRKPHCTGHSIHNLKTLRTSRPL